MLVQKLKWIQPFFRLTATEPIYGTDYRVYC